LFDCFCSANAHGPAESHSPVRERSLTDASDRTARFVDEEWKVGQVARNDAVASEELMLNRGDDDQLVVTPCGRFHQFVYGRILC
jgi:hypothetical protein